MDAGQGGGRVGARSRRPHRLAPLLDHVEGIGVGTGHQGALGRGVTGGGRGELVHLGPRQGAGAHHGGQPGQVGQAPAGLQGAPGPSGRSPLQGGEQAGSGPVALVLPVARLGDPGGEQRLGRHHQALEATEVAVAGGGVPPEQAPGLQVGHERGQGVGQRGQPGRQTGLPATGHRGGSRTGGRPGRTGATAEPRPADRWTAAHREVRRSVLRNGWPAPWDETSTGV